MTLDRLPCVWCNLPTVSRNELGEPVCDAYECRSDDYATRVRRDMRFKVQDPNDGVRVIKDVRVYEWGISPKEKP